MWRVRWASRRLSTATLEKQYQRMTAREHVLLRPEMYVGPLQVQERTLWVWDDVKKRIVCRDVKYVPGLLKIFDEILVNAADNQARDQPRAAKMSYIDVKINAKKGEICVENDGSALPVAIHPAEMIYVPELVFGHLLTSSNFDDERERFTGGRHGYGAKLVNIFSNSFDVRVYDASRKLEFHQLFTDNMMNRSDPQVKDRSEKGSKSSWTRITFRPDLKRFLLDDIDADILSLMQRRVVDIAACNPRLDVRLNGRSLKVPSLADYIALHAGLDASEFASINVNKQWQLAVGPTSSGRFESTSFVNSVATMRGGSHVDAVVAQIRHYLSGVVEKELRRSGSSTPRIKDFLHVFLICTVANPAFESQTKEMLTTPANTFAKHATLSHSALEAIRFNTKIVDNILTAAEKRSREILKKTDGRKLKQVLVPKLEDANWAGGRNAAQCCLILTEGDSAKALAVSGLSVLGRDRFGVYPLRGKLLNVRDASASQIADNKELLYLKQILGLQTGKKYTDVSELRYGQVMLMADQDHDGSHIKGLVINMIHNFWPDLLRIPGFLTQFVTPIVRCRKGDREKHFFTLPDYEAWRARHTDWKAKYYKGLGTSSAAEAKEYFSHLGQHRVSFKWGPRKEDDDLIDLCFKADRSDDRKEWLAQIKPGTSIDYSKGAVTFSDFVNRELILFSMADNIRSIPSLADGLKPGQRKILYACFKRNLSQEIKVAQLAGYVAEHTAYHHGEVALCNTIVGLAQNFVGSNNINLLEPSGQFGTRHAAGQDAASSRYIFTRLMPWTRDIFVASDDKLLKSTVEDEMVIEPEFYVPTIPMVLVNGSTGIGTGWSSNIPNHCPLQIISRLRKMISGRKSTDDLFPHYRGFAGRMSRRPSPAGLLTDGVIRILDDRRTVEILELPIGRSTTSYKEYLDSLLVSGSITSHEAHHTDERVRFVVRLSKQAATDALTKDDLLKMFRLRSALSLTNMVLFDVGGCLRRYDSVDGILDEFVQLRRQFYKRRKQILEDELIEQLETLHNRLRFIEAVASDKLVIRGRRKAQLVDELDRQKYRLRNGSFDYLLGMPLLSISQDKLDSLRAEHSACSAELDTLKSRTIDEMWLADLDRLEKAIVEEAPHWSSVNTSDEHDDAAQTETSSSAKKRPGRKTTKAVVGAKRPAKSKRTRKAK
ncbi:DNA topoisomerase 2 [Plasmodiophora brassicae]|uniref:DNA topoisomerase 2 n=2 Tax=Plasmodiophora brassicae TaxID=37360 RepID=A0A3P3YIN2_PLABS|nr:unnamed protein product [Plasmodiophora brassicae]